MILLPLFFAAASAAPPPDVTDDALDEVVVTAARRETDRSEIGASVAVIGRDEIADAKLITDALASQPGVALQQTTPGQGAAIVRGLKGSAVLHLVDGMRLSNAIFRTAPTPWFALVPSAATDRIEVVRGTPASLYGSEAVGGVVQAVSRLPQIDGDETAFHGDVSATFDTAEQQRSIRGTLEVGTNRLATILNAGYLETGDRKVGGGKRIGPSGYESRSVRAAVVGRPNDETSWLIDLQHLEQPMTPRVDELVPGFDQTEPSSSEFFFAPNERSFAHVRYETTVGTLDWKIDGAWQRIVDDRITRDLAAPVRRHENNRSDLYGVTVNVSGGSSAEWIAGVDAYHDRVSSDRVSEDLLLGTTSPATPRFPDGSSITQGAMFGNLRIPAGDRHHFTGGLRFSAVRIDLPESFTTRNIDISRVSGDAGWLFDVTDQWQVAANVGFGFRAPNIADLGTLGNRPGNRFNIPNPNLGAEDVVHADAGLRYFGNELRFEAVAFAVDYGNRITSVLTGDVTPDGRDIVQSVNAAASEIIGIELGFNWSVTDALSVNAIANYTRGEQRTANDPAEPGDRIPPLNGRLSLRYEQNENWAFDAWLVAADRQDRLSARDVRDVRINPLGTPDWSRAGIGATWRPREGWRIALTLDNLADKRYREHGSGIDAAGRNASLTVEKRW